MERDPNDWQRFRLMARRMAQMLAIDVHQEFTRASGDVLCLVCGLSYFDHPTVENFLTILCNGNIVKL